MLLAIRKSDGKTVEAYFEHQRNGPFQCPDCGEEVALRRGASRTDHFAHVNLRACEFATPESEAHLKCKIEIFKALQTDPSVTEVTLERSFGSVRPDVYAVIKGVPVAIEVQISSLSVERIMERTISYHQKGIYVLWLLQWTPDLDRERYAPSHWEKWIHACYFGRVFYWVKSLEVAEYEFEPALKMIPKKTWIGRNGKLQKVGGYVQRSVRFRSPQRRNTLNLIRDFGPRIRYWWEGGGINVPDAKLYIALKPFIKSH